MKKMMMLLMLTGILISCSKKDNEDKNMTNGLIGEWKLIELLADPGDGSGVFQPVNSNKIIEIYNTGVIISNGDLCTMSIDANVPSSGTYSMIDSTINAANCELTFEVDGNDLIVYYPCIEPCVAKYERQFLQ